MLNSEKGSGLIDDLFSVAEAADKAGQPRWRIYAWIRRKQGLPIQRRGKRIYIAGADLEAYLKQQGGIMGPPTQENGSTKADPVAIGESDKRTDNVNRVEPLPASSLKPGNSGQRELRPSPRTLGRGFFFVPEWT